MARIGKAAFSFPFDPEQMRYNLKCSPPYCRHGWFVAVAYDQVVGFACYDQWEGSYHPRKFSIDLWVDPPYQRRGIGSKLYETLMAALAPFEPLSIATDSRESLPNAMRFLQERGFTEGLRKWQSTLLLDTFDPTLSDTEERLQEQGIVIRPYADLTGDPELDWKLFDLVSTVRMDEPTTEPLTPLNYESWVRELHEYPDFLPEYYLIATHGDRFVGQSVLWRSPEEGQLNTGLTGVRRAYRNRGIALAMKVRLLTRAKEAGYKQVITFNAAVNRAMLGINERLGFVKTPAWIDYVKVLRTE
ncbi:MAG: GNAT family N-acetyltransferase [Mycobacterium leprae]